jgi:hypothetical protein
MWCGDCYVPTDQGLFNVRLPKDEEGYVLRKKGDDKRFQYARNGDHFMTTFQCDLCHFRNIQGRDPVLGNGETDDSYLLKLVRRANLDALWCRESGTVKSNLKELKIISQGADILKIRGESLLPKMGPYPAEDTQSMALAAIFLQRTLDSGINEATLQFDSARKLRSAYSNAWHASVEGKDEMVMVQGGKRLVHSTCPTNARWYERFQIGAHKRMGNVSKPDMAVSIKVMLALMKRFDDDWLEAGLDRDEQERVLFPALFSVIAFCAALRGEEVPLMSLGSARTHYKEALEDPDFPHVIVPLLGRFKRETGERHHFMPLVLETASGLQPKVWMERMLKWYDEANVTTGWVFRAKDGKQAKASKYEYAILVRLESIQQEEDNLIPSSVDVYEAYGVSRSFRRGSTTRAQNRKVDEMDIVRNNRWRTEERAKGMQPRLQMMHHYTDVKQSLESLLRYSAAL